MMNRPGSMAAMLAIGAGIAAMLVPEIAHAALPPGNHSIFDLTQAQIAGLQPVDLKQIVEVAAIKKAILGITGAIVAGGVFFLAYRYMNDNERFNGMLVGQVLGGIVALVGIVAFAMDSIIIFILKRMAQ